MCLWTPVFLIRSPRDLPYFDTTWHMTWQFGHPRPGLEAFASKLRGDPEATAFNTALPKSWITHILWDLMGKPVEHGDLTGFKTGFNGNTSCNSPIILVVGWKRFPYYGLSSSPCKHINQSTNGGFNGQKVRVFFNGDCQVSQNIKGLVVLVMLVAW